MWRTRYQFVEKKVMQKLLSDSWNTFIEHRNNPLSLLMLTTGTRRTQKRRQKLKPVPNLSRASACVWQMDREA